MRAVDNTNQLIGKIARHAPHRASWAKLASRVRRRFTWDEVASPPPELTRDRAIERRPEASVEAAETPVDRARRLGYIVHGISKLKIAYAPDVIADKVVAAIERGSYERPEGRTTERLVAAGDRVIELGAGLGYLSAKIMTSTDVADYVAVEADPRLPDVILRTHELNGVTGPLTVKSCVATCSAEMIAEQSVDFHVSKKFCASSLRGAGRLKHTVKVPVVPLTDVIDEHQSNVLICDIEGSETDIFNGTDLGTITRIMMEIHPQHIGDSGVREIFDNLDQLGFVYDVATSEGAAVGFRKRTG